MAETTPPKSKRDQYLERLASKYPDKTYDDDEALFGQINDDYDSYENELQGYRDESEKIDSLFASDPRSARFMMAWSKGGDPLAALIREYGDDFMEQMQDPDKQEELAEASKEYAERMAKNKEYEEQYQQNLQQTLADIETVQQEDGLTDDEVDEAMTFLIGVMKDGLLGKFSPESIRMARAAINHDIDVDLASEEGEVRGRNANITMQKRASKRGDGLPNMGGRNGRGEKPRQQDSIFAQAEEAL